MKKTTLKMYVLLYVTLLHQLVMISFYDVDS